MHGPLEATLTALQLVTPAAVVTGVILLALPQVPPPPEARPQVVAVPAAEACAKESPAPAASPPAAPPPAAPPILVHTTLASERLVVVDLTRASFEALGARAFARPLRVVPHEERGEVTGLKLYGLREDAPLAALGLRSGDVVREVNGCHLAAPECAFAALGTRPGHLDLRLIRRGRPLRLLVLLRDAPPA